MQPPVAAATHSDAVPCHNGSSLPVRACNDEDQAATAGASGGEPSNSLDVTDASAAAPNKVLLHTYHYASATENLRCWRHAVFMCLSVSLHPEKLVNVISQKPTKENFALLVAYVIGFIGVCAD